MLDTLTAPPEAVEAVKARAAEEASRLAFIEAEKKKARKRREKEAARIQAVKDEKERQRKARLASTVVTEGGKSRSVNKVKTTTDKMLTNDTLPKYLKLSLDRFAILVADAHGAATEDEDDSTNRLTSPYEPFSGGSGFESKTLSDRQINGATALRKMERRLPEELKPLFWQIMAEEIGTLTEKGRNLSEWGERAGYRHKQSSAAGGMQVQCVLMMVNQFLKDKGVDRE